MTRDLKISAIALVFSAAGCSSIPPAPTADVAVAVSCVTNRPERLVFRGESEILAFDDYRAIIALRAERLKATKYISELEDVVDVCERAPSVVTVPR